MASRQARKLRKQQELLDLQKGATAGSDESDDEPVVAKPRANVFSGFAALGDMGDDDDDDGNKSDESEDKTEKPQMSSAADQGAAKKSKKSKKKKKKGKKADAAQPAAIEAEPLDEIDRALQELKLAESRPSAPSSSLDPPVEQLRDLLRVNFQHLKAMNEMRKMFGGAMDAAAAEDNPQQNRPRDGPRQEVDLETYLSVQPAAPGLADKKAMFDRILRLNPFIEGKKTWPRDSTRGLGMASLTTDTARVPEYTFCHDKYYDELEGGFFQLVQMYDPMLLVHNLHRHPYHVSSLIQVSKVAKQDQNASFAADLIERALFTFGRVSLKDFRKKLEEGRVYMDFNRPENRQFFLAGWFLIQYLALKGTNRTALEWAKLFLSINHEDPYAMINWVHVLAIRAHEARWFVDLCKTRLFDDSRGIPASIYAKQTLALAHLQLGDAVLAKTVLIEGMERLPWLYCALFSAMNLDTPKSIWGVQPRTDDEKLHTKLYIHMAKELWDSPRAISLLNNAANEARKVNVTALPVDPPVSLSTARFIYLDNKPDMMSAVPRQMLHQSPNFDFDPLPPAKSENIFSSPVQQLPWTPQTNDLPSGLPPFLNDPRVRAAFAARRNQPGGPRPAWAGGGGSDDEEGPEQLERVLDELRRTQNNEGDPQRGFLGRLLDMMTPDLATLGGANEGADSAQGMHLPGAWGDEYDGWDEGYYDFEEEEQQEVDEDELPPLVPLTPHVRPLQATVEDAEDDSDDDMPNLV
ncbi:hypothetical protein OQA88_1065 [Cercophora sp. LCS_1]